MAEQRNFFRVNQDVLIDCHGVDAYTADNDQPEDQFEEILPMQLFAAFRQIDAEAQDIAQNIGDGNRHLLNYMQCLNHKIDILARELISQKLPEQSQNRSKINLSEGGIAFLSDKAYYKGSFLAIKLVFLPSYTGVILFAKVLRCDSPKGDQYHIAAKFHRINASQQQILAKAILDTQKMNKRGNRKPEPAPERPS